MRKIQLGSMDGGATVVVRAAVELVAAATRVARALLAQRRLQPTGGVVAHLVLLRMGDALVAAVHVRVQSCELH